MTNFQSPMRNRQFAMVAFDDEGTWGLVNGVWDLFGLLLRDFLFSQQDFQHGDTEAQRRFWNHRCTRIHTDNPTIQTFPIRVHRCASVVHFLSSPCFSVSVLISFFGLRPKAALGFLGKGHSHPVSQAPLLAYSISPG